MEIAGEKSGAPNSDLSMRRIVWIIIFLIIGARLFGVGWFSYTGSLAKERNSARLIGASFHGMTAYSVFLLVQFVVVVLLIARVPWKRINPSVLSHSSAGKVQCIAEALFAAGAAFLAALPYFYTARECTRLVI